MSNSFWKFGSGYSTESSVTKILNKAFIKIQKDSDTEITETNTNDTSSDTESNLYTASSDAEHDQDTTIVTLPDTEEDYDDYEPNLEVLDDLLDDEELYTELMCSNFQLLIYLKYSQVLDKLVEYTITEHKNPDKLTNDNSKNDSNRDEIFKTDEQQKRETEDEEMEETEDDIARRRANMAAEILSADVWPVSNALIHNPDTLNKLWSVMRKTEPISTDISTYFMKINERLLDSDMTSMINFIKSQNLLVDTCLLHIDNPPLMDFLLKVISTDKPDSPNGILQKLKRDDFIPKLMDKLSPECDSNIQSASADFLKAFIAISGNCIDEIPSGIGPNEITRELASPKIMKILIDSMLKGGTALSNGVGIIIELIRKNNSDYDYIQVMHTTIESHPPNDRDPIYLGHMLNLFAENIPAFYNILVETTTPILDTSFGRIEPVGFARFKICELIAELLHCSNMSLLNQRKAEQLIKERDTIREDFLTKQLEEVASPDGEEMTTKLNSLQIDSSQQMDQDEAMHETIEESDIIDDSDEVAESLRNDPVVGDKLKMAIFDTQIVSTILEMLFHFSWNNFLHNVVFDIIQQIFNGPLKISFNKFLIKDLLGRAEITRSIIDGDKESENKETGNHLRLGYMGHLTLIAEEVVKFSIYVEELKLTFASPVIPKSLNDESWKEYVNSILRDTREKYDMVLGEIVDENGDIITEEGEEDEDEQDEQDDEYDQHDMLYEEQEDEEKKDPKKDKDEYHDKNELYSEHSEDDESNDLDMTEKDEEDEDNRFDKYMSNEIGRTFDNSLSIEESNDDSNSGLDGREKRESEYIDDSKSFLINGLRKRSHPASPELQDEDIFQHQFQLDEMKSDEEISDEDNSDEDFNDPVVDDDSYMSGNSLHRTNNISYSQVLSLSEDDDISDDSDAELEDTIDDSEFKYKDGDNNDDYDAYSLYRSKSKDNAS